MDKLGLRGLEFHAYHGVSEEERRLGQKFIVHVEMYADLECAAESDQLKDTIDYKEIYEQIAEVMVGESYALIETLAEKIADRILSNQLVEEVVLRVIKLKPPIDGHVDEAFVEISRKRSS